MTLHALHFKPADALIRALSNGLLFAESDMKISMLAAIKFEFDGARLEALSTDHRRACIEPVELHPGMDQTGQSAFEFLLPRDAAKAALAFLKGNRRDEIQLTHDTTSGTVRLSAYGSSVEYATLALTAHPFPALRHLFPALVGKAPVRDIGFTAKLLTDLAKVSTSRQTGVIKLNFFGGSAAKAKQILVEFVDGPRIVLMPCEIPAA